MIVLDAGLLIAVLDARDAHHSWANEVIVATADERIAASALSMAESLVRPVGVGVGVAADAERALRGLGLEVLAIAADDALPLAEVRAATGLRMPDAAVLFTAERMGAALATTDVQLGRVAAARGLVVHAPD